MQGTNEVTASHDGRGSTTPPVLGYEHWRRLGDSKCDYCEYAADMVYKGHHACFEHRSTLIRDMEKQAETPEKTPKH